MKIRPTLVLILFAIAAAPVFAQGEPRYVEVLSRAVVCEGGTIAPPDFSNDLCETRDITDIDPQGRVIWIGATFDLPPSFLSGGEPLAVYIGALASSALYWNGQQIGTNGVPGESGETEIPGKLDAAFFVPQKLLVEGKNEIAIRMASFHNPIEVYAPVHYIYAAEAKPVAASLTFYYAPALLTAGAFILAAVYFGLLWLGDRKNAGAELIALMAFFAALQLLLESLRAFVDYSYPWQVWRLTGVMICAAGFGITLTAYLTRRFQPRAWKYYVIAGVSLATVAVIFSPGFDGRALFSLFAATVIALIALLRPAFAGEKGARLAAAALVVFIALMLIDDQSFLDRTFFLAAALLMLVMIADQVRAMRAIHAAKAAMQNRAERLELELLRRRIAPHFLMNTLNALIEWVESDPKVGVEMIGALAEEFRLLSQMSGKAQVPLFDEIALCRRHLEVMSYRVDRAFSLTVEAVDQKLNVPPGILHTLIENAFTHGRYEDGAEFKLGQYLDNGRVWLTLETPPAGEASGPEKINGGDGLAYVTRRLESAFGASASFSDGPGKNGGWVSTLSFEVNA